MSPGPRPTSLPSSILIHPGIWPQHRPKIGDCAPFGEGAAGFASNTMWPWPRPTSMPSFILIDSIVWSQYTNVTDRTAVQLHRIGRAQKWLHRHTQQLCHLKIYLMYPPLQNAFEAMSPLTNASANRSRLFATLCWCCIPQSPCLLQFEQTAWTASIFPSFDTPLLSTIDLIGEPPRSPDWFYSTAYEVMLKFWYSSRRQQNLGCWLSPGGATLCYQFD